MCSKAVLLSVMIIPMAMNSINLLPSMSHCISRTNFYKWQKLDTETWKIRNLLISCQSAYAILRSCLPCFTCTFLYAGCGEGGRRHHNRRNEGKRSKTLLNVRSSVQVTSLFSRETRDERSSFVVASLASCCNFVTPDEVRKWSKF